MTWGCISKSEVGTACKTKCCHDQEYYPTNRLLKSKIGKQKRWKLKPNKRCMLWVFGTCRVNIWWGESAVFFTSCSAVYEHLVFRATIKIVLKLTDLPDGYFRCTTMSPHDVLQWDHFRIAFCSVLHFYYLPEGDFRYATMSSHNALWCQIEL